MRSRAAQTPSRAAPGSDRLGVARVGGGPPIDGGTTRAGRVLRDMRRHPDPPKFGNHSPGVVVLVGTDSFCAPGMAATIVWRHLAPRRSLFG
jgi:hypothetical protein